MPRTQYNNTRHQTMRSSKRNKYPVFPAIKLFLIQLILHHFLSISPNPISSSLASAFQFHSNSTIVLSLPRHKQRQTLIKNELDQANIPFQILSNSVDGQHLTSIDLDSNTTKLAKWFMTPGMIGCFLSHRNAWEYCASSNAPVLILEDDATFVADFKQKVEMCMERMPKDWDVLLLGAIGSVHPRYRYGLNIIPSLVGGKWRRPRTVCSFQYTSQDDENKPEETNNQMTIHVPLCPFGMHAYILSPSGAQKLLNRFPKATFHVDAVAWGYKDLNLFAIDPLLAYQNTNVDTTIGGILPKWRRKSLFKLKADKYTGYELGWSLHAPLVRVGGPRLPFLLLTNGRSLGIMFCGFVSSFLLRSREMLVASVVYVASMVSLIRLLASQ